MRPKLLLAIMYSVGDICCTTSCVATQTVLYLPFNCWVLSLFSQSTEVQLHVKGWLFSKLRWHTSILCEHRIHKVIRPTGKRMNFVLLAVTSTLQQSWLAMEGFCSHSVELFMVNLLISMSWSAPNTHTHARTHTRTHTFFPFFPVSITVVPFIAVPLVCG